MTEDKMSKGYRLESLVIPATLALVLFWVYVFMQL